jgi:hypothetical protein
MPEPDDPTPGHGDSPLDETPPTDRRSADDPADTEDADRVLPGGLRRQQLLEEVRRAVAAELSRRASDPPEDE